MIYLAQKMQISFLNMKKSFKSILAKYINYANIFLKKLAIKLSKYFNINKYLINLKPDK